MISIKQFSLAISFSLFSFATFAYPVRVIYSFKPWSELTDMRHVEKVARAVKINTLEWLSSNYQDIGYGREALNVSARIDSAFEETLETELRKLEEVQDIKVEIASRQSDSQPFAINMNPRTIPMSNDEQKYLDEILKHIDEYWINSWGHIF